MLVAEHATHDPLWKQTLGTVMPWEHQSAPLPNLLGIGPDDIHSGGAIGYGICAGLTADFVQPDTADRRLHEASVLHKRSGDHPPSKTILALVTASDGVCSKAPILEFRLKSEGDESEALAACHRVRAYLHNQTVSEGALLFKDSTTCGGRTHFFDLGVLNLAFYGASAWEVANVGPLPTGPLSMVLLDTHGTSARLDVTSGSPSRAIRNPPALGTFSASVDRLVPDGMPAGINLGWKSVGAPTVPSIDATPETIDVAPLETGLPAARDAPSGTSGPKPAGPAKFIAAPASKSHYLPLAAAKKPSSRGIDKPRTKLSRRMAATLSFFADNNSIRSKPAVAETKRCRSASAVRKTTLAPAAQTLSVNELLADLARSDREREGCNDDVTDLLDSFMQSEENQEEDAFDLAEALAAELLKAPCSKPAALALDLPMPMLQWEPSPLL